MVARSRWPVLVVTGIILLLAGCARPAAPAKLFVHDMPVQYRLGNNEARELIPPNWQPMDVSNAVTAGDQGKARLLFGDSLAVEIYRNTVLRTKGMVVTAGDQTTGLRLDDGTINVTERLTQQRVSVETDWAVIKSLGTVFFAHYDRPRGMTWVVVKEGRVSVTAGGVEIIVSAGQQTWVEPGGQPAGPFPACRSVVGTRFPVTEELTNDYIPDIELLCQPEPTPAPGRGTEPVPTPQPAATSRPTSPIRPVPATPIVSQIERLIEKFLPRRPAAGGTPPTGPATALKCNALAIQGPADGAVFRGSNANVTLSWTSVGNLGPDEYYVVTSEFPHDNATWQDTQSTKETSIQMPRYLYDNVTGSHRVTWRVSVQRQVGSGTSRAASWTQVCPDTSPRSYTWTEPSAPAPAPATSPATGSAGALLQDGSNTTGGAMVGSLLGLGLALGLLLVRRRADTAIPKVPKHPERSTAPFAVRSRRMRPLHERFGVLRLRPGHKPAGTPLRMPPHRSTFGIPGAERSAKDEG